MEFEQSSWNHSEFEQTSLCETEIMTPPPSPQPIIPFPPFPMDVARLIVEKAGDCSRETAGALSQACRTFYIWLIPALFDTVVLSSYTDSHNIMARFVHRLKHPHYGIPVGQYVKTIQFYGSTDFKCLALLNTVAQLCENLENLSVDPEVLQSASLWRLSHGQAQFSSLRPQKLELHLGFHHSIRFAAHFGSTLLEAVTHLHIPLDLFACFTSCAKDGRLRAPALSHLAIRMPYQSPPSPWDWEDIFWVLEVPRLQLLVTWFPNTDKFCQCNAPFEEPAELQWTEKAANFLNQVIWGIQPTTPRQVDRRLVLCQGPLPINTTHGDYRMLFPPHEEFWDWAEGVAKAQVLVFRPSQTTNPLPFHRTECGEVVKAVLLTLAIVLFVTLLDLPRN